eukprot:CAMPEP_0175097024 /NCGR_PEP_ID=MMETSP0086_2-20121207/5058_1 /TAXON_ID=136419 /ORGANISM="Unknown Unknown, Strain D1" /LENGTH=344 /DNA_ID=CAMNT_0016370491 /DNA_START=15 /DNA_END=1046 /DNA_ORIENTATION=-
MDTTKEMQDRIQQLRTKLESFRDSQATDGQHLSAVASQLGCGNPVRDANLKPRRVLRGHYGKIYSMSWGQDSTRVVSASQDGNIIIWNALSGLKEQAIRLQSSWVMACDISPSGRAVCSGGLDNFVEVFNLSDNGVQKMAGVNLIGHQGYLSCCKFISDTELLTSSGDGTCRLWDVEAQCTKLEFSGHRADVMELDVSGSTFVSGSCDTTAKLWDMRTGSCLKTFTGHEADINTVKFLPGTEHAFATGSDDSTCRLFDIRAYRQINCYQDFHTPDCVTSVAFSGSGRYFFSTYSDTPKITSWDTITGNIVQELESHDQRISKLSMSPDGKALASASWDGLVKIW